MLHPLSSEIVEFPFRIPTQIGIVDDGLDDIPWVVRSFSSEGGGLEVTRRGNEGSDLNKQTRSKTSAFRSVSSSGWEMAIGWTGRTYGKVLGDGRLDFTLHEPLGIQRVSEVHGLVIPSHLG